MNTENIKRVARCLKQARDSGAGLIIFTGAGISVASGVPVFRNSDGSMSEKFLGFLAEYNAARRKAGLGEASDWFEFSVPEMFNEATALEAWHYWRWRMLRAQVTPARDYKLLNKLIRYFGAERVFVKTSNCDMLHYSYDVDDSNDPERSSSSSTSLLSLLPSATGGNSIPIPNLSLALQIEEIHGSLGRLQCSRTCCQTLHTTDGAFLARLRDEPDWVPMCPKCKVACLRPNVMIFNDWRFISTELDKQGQDFHNFLDEHFF